MCTRNLLISIFVASIYGISSANCKYADITDYPYHVSVEYNEVHSCSGALIAELWVLTVAACVFSNGSTNLTVRAAAMIPSTGGDQVEVRSIILQDDFDTISYENDIALLRLRVPLVYGDGKLPILLPYADYKIADGTLTLITGWTAKAQRNSTSQLTVVSTPIINRTVCESNLPVFKELTDSMLCAGYMSSGAEVCQGNIGSPLVYDDQLVGLLSYGLGCVNPTFPAIYTRISSFVPWILKYTGIIFRIK